MKNQRILGSAAVALAYCLWGFLTLYWNLLSEADPLYILAHRIFWSMIFMGIFIFIAKRTAEIKTVFRSKQDLALCFACGILITVNWGAYIIAVMTDHILDASLGYFIEPILVSVIGMLAFKERLSKWETITLCFSVIGLLYMIVTTRTMPALALIIAGSFAVYGAVKKRLGISAETSLFTETLCMAPFAFAFILLAEQNGSGALGILQGAEFLLLPLCGIVTSVPLLLFNIGVKKIPYYISGLLMYINPTIQFLMGLFFFGEPMNIHRLIAFIIIWVGISFTVYEKIRLIRSEKRTTP